MDYSEALSYIHSRKRFGSTLGLERIRALLALLGNPEKRVKCVHVAGTNGKGSTSAMFAEVFTRAGYKTGLYVSPFVEDFRERIQIDRRLIPEADLARWVEKLVPLCEKAEALTGTPVTEFELETALAFGYYEEQNCDLAVMEVGLGGRFDATNVIEDPLLAAICFIGLDHTAILGDTYAKIAFEKCGIVKPGRPVVSYADQRPEAAEVIREECRKKGSPLTVPSLGDLEILSLSPDGSDFRYRGEVFHLAIPGAHIVKNALSVIEGCRLLAPDFPELSEKIGEALENVSFGGRFEKIAPDVYIDAAHNPDCVDAVCDTLEKFFSGRKKTVVMGILADKDHAYCVEKVARLADRFFA
ncbi:MAG: bifunctional folylpolyglutamate synthase/dihydrofolate synthase, partial [Clostridia bacterium]|nr:bifunctional folylpolyglutamate synthase/dihydrofolate synthase [Clostridia bacterium]